MTPRIVRITLDVETDLPLSKLRDPERLALEVEIGGPNSSYRETDYLGVRTVTLEVPK